MDGGNILISTVCSLYFELLLQMLIISFEHILMELSMKYKIIYYYNSFYQHLEQIQLRMSCTTEQRGH